jgi:hypothetical protein
MRTINLTSECRRFLNALASFSEVGRRDRWQEGNLNCWLATGARYHWCQPGPPRRGK